MALQSLLLKRGSGDEEERRVAQRKNDDDALGLEAEDEGKDQTKKTGTGLVKAIGKLTLTLAAESRIHSAITRTTFLIPTDADVVRASVEMGQTYALQVKQQGSGHDLGSPHVHIFLASLDVMMKATQASGFELHSIIQALGKYLIEQDSRSVVADVVSWWSVRKTFEKTTRRNFTKCSSRSISMRNFRRHSHQPLFIKQFACTLPK